MQQQTAKGGGASSAGRSGELARFTNPILSLKSDKELLDAALNEGDTAAPSR